MGIALLPHPYASSRAGATDHEGLRKGKLMKCDIFKQVLTLILFFSAGEVFAQGPPIHTDTPILLGLEGRGAMLRSMVLRKTTLYRDGSEIPDPLGREVTAVATVLAVPVNITTDLLVGITIPTMSVKMKDTGVTKSSFGLGDVSVFAKHVLIQFDRLGETFRVAAKGSVKLPTGDDERTPALGSGSLDYSLGAVGAWIGRRYGLYGDVSYSFNGTAHDLEYGNSLKYNAAVGFRLIPAVYETYPAEQVNLYIELNGEYHLKDESNGQDLPNTGGNVVFLSSGVQYIPSRILLLEASLQLPIVQSLNGTQLGTDFAFSGGVRLLLY